MCHRNAECIIRPLTQPRPISLTGADRKVRAGGSGCAAGRSAGLWFDERKRSRLLDFVLGLVIVHVSLKDGFEQVDGALRRRQNLHVITCVTRW